MINLLQSVSLQNTHKSVGPLYAKRLHNLCLAGYEQRCGSGTFIRRATPRLQQSLSSLVSFSENMAARGMSASFEGLFIGLCTPTPSELISLGLSTTDHVARVHRIRSADDCPMALEYSSILQDILPHPSEVKTSLNAVLRRS